MRRRAPALGLLLALLGTALSGCLASPAPVDPSGVPSVPDPFAAVAALVQDLPCEVDEVPADATSGNLRDVAKLDLPEGGRRGEVDIHAPWLLHARYDAGGFDVVDFRDPANPLLVATHEAEDRALDVKFTPDGTGALVGHTGGIHIVDLRDPAAPVAEGGWTFPDDLPLHRQNENAHMLYAYALGERQLVFLAPNTNTGAWILELTGAPGARQLELLAKVGGRLAGPLGPHDMWATWDPELETHLLYVANGLGGWFVADVADPASPRILGGMVPALDPYQSYHHTIQAAWIGGKRLVATISEVGANALKVYDATDLADPVLVATWTNSLNPTPPQHNLQIVGDKLYVAHYTAGAFVFDLAALPGAPAPGLWRPMAHYALDMAPSAHPLGFNGLWDVVLQDGLVVLGDMRSGIRVVAFGCLAPGDAALTSTG